MTCTYSIQQQTGLIQINHSHFMPPSNTTNLLTGSNKKHNTTSNKMRSNSNVFTSNAKKQKEEEKAREKIKNNKQLTLVAIEVGKNRTLKMPALFYDATCIRTYVLLANGSQFTAHKHTYTHMHSYSVYECSQKCVSCTLQVSGRVQFRVLLCRISTRSKRVFLGMNKQVVEQVADLCAPLLLLLYALFQLFFRISICLLNGY